MKNIRLKEDIRMIKSQRSNAEKNKLIEEGKKKLELIRLLRKIIETHVKKRCELIN